MGNERIDVKVFPNLIPGAYVFLDPCDDASKWAYTTGASAFNSIAEGDAYGYYGKGLRFTRTGVAQAFAVRSSLVSPGTHYVFSFTIKPSLGCYAGAYPNKAFSVENFVPAAAGGLNKKVLNIVTETALGGGGRGSIKIGFGTTYTSGIVTPIHQDDNIRLTVGINDLPWFRIKAVVRNDICIMVDVNGVQYTTNQTLFTDGNGFPAGIFLRGKHDLVGDLFWDLDQFSVSETENIV